MHRSAFTLVELMIVVAIIGILAAIAIPNFMDMQYRAKRAEVPMSTDAIVTVENAYEAAFDEFISEPTPRPRATPNKVQVSWTGGSAFDTLGWRPDGAVRGIYSVTTAGTGQDFTAIGQSDVDADGRIARYTATRSISVSFHNNNDTF